MNHDAKESTVACRVGDKAGQGHGLPVERFQLGCQHLIGIGQAAHDGSTVEVEVVVAVGDVQKTLNRHVVDKYAIRTHKGIKLCGIGAVSLAEFDFLKACDNDGGIGAELLAATVSCGRAHDLYDITHGDLGSAIQVDQHFCIGFGIPDNKALCIGPQYDTACAVQTDLCINDGLDIGIHGIVRLGRRPVKQACALELRTVVIADHAEHLDGVTDGGSGIHFAKDRAVLAVQTVNVKLVAQVICNVHVSVGRITDRDDGTGHNVQIVGRGIVLHGVTHGNGIGN